MPRRPSNQKKMSMKTRLSLILIMFIVINLVFYFMFEDSSESSEESVDINGKNQLNMEKNTELGQQITNPITP